jgi:diguanylate cyclase (GGDEF)-like protein/PAS domain S-box-containing protein
MKLNIFSWRSLKTRITLFTLAIFVISVWSLAFFASRMLQEDMQHQLSAQQFSTVSIIAHQIENEFRARLSSLERVAARVSPAMMSNQAALEALLDEHVILQSLFNGGVLISRADGTAVAEAPSAGGRVGGNFMDHDGLATALKEGKAAVGKPHFAKRNRNPEFDMAVPIRDAQGVVIGALSGETNLALPNFLDQINDSHYGKTGSYLLVSRPDRLVVTSTNKRRILDPAPAPGVNLMIDRFMQGFEGSAVLIDPSNVEVLASAKGIASANWYVASALPAAEAFAPIHAMQRRLLLATLALTVLAGGLTWWLLRRELAPLVTVANTLAALPDASPFPQALPIARLDEIGQLIGGFNRLLTSLQQRETLLKQILDTSSVAIFVLDAQGRIVQANQRMALMFGYPLEALVGLDYATLVHPAQREAARQSMLALLADQVPSNDLDRLYWHCDQTEFWGHLTCRSFHDTSTEQRCLVGVITDVNERKQSERFEQFRSHILELLASGESLPNIFEKLARGVEQLNPALTCSIVLADQPEPCLDPTLTNNAALSTCWSQPIVSTSGRLLGNFSIRQRGALTPAATDIALVQRFARVASIVLERRADAEKVRDSEERFRALIEESPAAICVHRDGKILYVNPAAINLIGASSAQELVGQPVLERIHPDFRQIVRARVQSVSDSGTHVALMNEKYLKLDGSTIDVEVQSTAMIYDGQAAVRTAFRDITERKLANDKLQLAASVFSHAREGITITDAQVNIIDVNEAFCHITGYSRAEVLGRNPRFLSSSRQGKQFYATMWRDLSEKGHWYGEIWNQRKSGEVYPTMLTISAVRNEQGEIQHYVSLFSDISLIKAHQHELEHIAHFDALTNLPNRVLLADRLQQGMVQTQRRGKILALAYLDLDGFKTINDRHGHEAGDLLLMTVATRMKQSLREGDTLARIGGDEFVAVLLDLSNNQASVPMLQRLLAAAAEPVQLGELALQVSASLGVTFYPQVDQVEADQLLRQADQAMYLAKQAGKNRYHFFDTEQDRSVRGQHESIERIRQALAAHEFVLHYQPKVNMRNGAVIGAEALIRWQHPDKGLLAPALFLPVIEDDPMAVEIGEWVIDTALTQIELWQADGLDVPVSVNVGARQLQQADFVPRLRELLAAHPRVKPWHLEVEVLETSALEDLVGVSQVIEDCHHLGVRFSMDDFGTGYSSLTYLKRLRVTLLKIDQSFVRDMLDDPDDRAILEGIIGLASAFRRDVIAEGVETIAHGTLLLQLGCDLAQGFGIARPMAAELFPAWATHWQRDAAWIAVCDI